MKLFHPAVLVVLFAAPAAAQAIYLETVCGSSVLDGAKTYCDSGVTFDMAVGGTSDIMAVQLAAPASHCSPVSYLLATPPPQPSSEPTLGAVPATPLQPIPFGGNVLGVTEVLQPGESEMLTLGRGWARGSHRLMVMVIGQVADCNVGEIHSWGVTVEPLIIPE